MSGSTRPAARSKPAARAAKKSPSTAASIAASSTGGGMKDMTEKMGGQSAEKLKITSLRRRWTGEMQSRSTTSSPTGLFPSSMSATKAEYRENGWRGSAMQ